MELFDWFISHLVVDAILLNKPPLSYTTVDRASLGVACGFHTLYTSITEFNASYPDKAVLETALMYASVFGDLRYLKYCTRPDLK